MNIHNNPGEYPIFPLFYNLKKCQIKTREMNILQTIIYNKHINARSIKNLLPINLFDALKDIIDHEFTSSHSLFMRFINFILYKQWKKWIFIQNYIGEVSDGDR